LTRLGELVGFAISEEGDKSFKMFAGKRYGFLYTEILACVRESWSTRSGSLAIVIADSDARKTKALEAAGFKRGTGREATMVYEIGSFEIPSAVLPYGFTLLDMAESADYDGQMRLRRFHRLCQRDHGGRTGLHPGRFQAAGIRHV
jgi:hypothetical protein